MTTRRHFLKSSAFLAAASAAGIAGAPQFAFGQTTGGKTLIKIFMRGGADGMHLFPPVGDMLYYQHRPNLAIDAPSSDASSAIGLGGQSYRALNPNLQPMMEIWEAGRLMISPSSCMDEGNRSHFDNQRWVGTGAHNNFIDGYLNRYLQTASTSDHAIRGAVFGKTSISTEIRGEVKVPAVRRSGDFDLRNGLFCGGDDCSENRLTDLMREIGSHQVDQPSAEALVRETQIVMLDTIDEVKGAIASTSMTDPNGNLVYVPSAGGLDYSQNSLGHSLKLVAQLLKAGVPLEVAALDWNIGWDTHSNQISDAANPITDQDFGYNRRMREGALDFLTFYRDISSMIDDVVVVVGTEFGRTVIENGSRGTDHGHGGPWFSFGGPSRSIIAPDVESLDPSNLLRERYLPNVVNYRDIVSELMIRHMNMPQNLVSTVFPGHTFTDHRLFGGST